MPYFNAANPFTVGEFHRLITKERGTQRKLLRFMGVDKRNLGLIEPIGFFVEVEDKAAYKLKLNDWDSECLEILQKMIPAEVRPGGAVLEAFSSSGLMEMVMVLPDNIGFLISVKCFESQEAFVKACNEGASKVAFYLYYIGETLNQLMIGNYGLLNYADPKNDLQHRPWVEWLREELVSKTPDFYAESYQSDYARMIEFRKTHGK